MTEVNAKNTVCNLRGYLVFVLYLFEIQFEQEGQIYGEATFLYSCQATY